MSFLHKYAFDNKTVYVVSEESSKPSRTINVPHGAWVGRAISGKALALKQLNAIKFSREGKEDKEDKIEEDSKKNKSLKASVVDHVRELASSIKD